MPSARPAVVAVPIHAIDVRSANGVSAATLDESFLTDTDSPTLDETLALNDRQLAVWQALKTLSPKLRETAVLRYYHGLRYQEIGDILGIPAKTAESRMRLVHKAMREILKEQDIF